MSGRNDWNVVYVPVIPAGELLPRRSRQGAIQAVIDELVRHVNGLLASDLLTQRAIIEWVRFAAELERGRWANQQGPNGTRWGVIRRYVPA